MCQEKKEQEEAKPVVADVVKSIIDRFGTEGASSKDLRIATVTSLGFAGLFRSNEFSPTAYSFTMSFLKFWYQRAKQTGIERGTI